MKFQPLFLLGFFYHHVEEDLRLAKKLYKEALRRAEFTKGCFQMLMSIYLQQYSYQKSRVDYEGYQRKAAKLEATFGHFLKYEQSIQRQRDRIS